MVGFPFVRATAGPARASDHARTPDGRSPGNDGRTNDSARPVVGLDPARQRRRSPSPASLMAADHRTTVGVNRDASLFCGEPGNALAARHADGALAGRLDSGVRRTAGCGVAPAGRSPPRNKVVHDRSNGRSAPAPGSPRTGTNAPAPCRRGRSRKQQVDHRPHGRHVDPACVPSTVWGTASSATAKFTSAPCLPLKTASFYRTSRRRGSPTRGRNSPRTTLHPP